MADTTSEKKPIYKKAWFWIVIVVVCLVIGFAGQGNNASDDTKTETNSTAQTQATDTKADVDIEQIADFIDEYDNQSESPFTDIEKLGSAASVAYKASSFDHEFELRYINNQLGVQINNTDDFSELLKPFEATVNTLDPSVASEAQKVFDTAVASMSEEEDYSTTMGDLNINFSAPNSKETGHIQVYKKYQK